MCPTFVMCIDHRALSPNLQRGPYDVSSKGKEDFHGVQNLPFYRIFAADSRSPRDGKHIEILGHYDPIPGEKQSAAF